MKSKYFVLSFVFFLFLEAIAAAASEDLTEHSPDRSDERNPRRLFVYETNQDDAQESLDRISGDYDLGFSLPSQSFKSEDHYMPGPFSHEKSSEKLE
jgi:hypothetical protein